MPRAGIDALGLARRLRDRAGFTPENAEEAATAIADAMRDEIATRSDLAELEADLARLVRTVATGQVALLIGAMLALSRQACRTPAAAVGLRPIAQCVRRGCRGGPGEVPGVRAGNFIDKRVDAGARCPTL